MAGLELRVVRRRVWRRLWQEDRIEVVAEPWIGRPLLRVSAQAYTTRDDLERLDRGTPGDAALR